MRLPHRRDRRDAVPARRARPHRRDLQLCRAPTAGAPREAASERFHLSEYRQDPRPEARPRPDVLRSPGRHCRGSHSPGARRQCLQSANRRGDPRYDSHAGSDGRCERTGSAARRNVRNAFGRSPEPCGAIAEAAKGIVLLGHALGTSGVASFVSQPVYVDRGGAAYSGASPIGSYRAVNPDDPYCRGGGGFGSGGGFVYASSGGGPSSSSSVWSSKSYTVEPVRTTVMRGGFGSSASSAPSSSSRVASAPSASPSSSVARGGFGATAAAYGSGRG
jgi:hypothetical protein